MSNLVSTFIAVETKDKGGTLAEAIRAMNRTLGTSYTHSRVREWESGRRQPTPKAMDYMLSVVLPVLLAREGISAKRAETIMGVCSLPKTGNTPS